MFGRAGAGGGAGPAAAPPFGRQESVPNFRFFSIIPHLFNLFPMLILRHSQAYALDGMWQWWRKAKWSCGGGGEWDVRWVCYREPRQQGGGGGDSGVGRRRRRMARIVVSRG